MPEQAADTPPTIPGLVWDEYLWRGTVALPAWEAFNLGTGPWKAVRAATLARRRKREKAADQLTDHYPPSTDPLDLTLYPEGNEEERRPPAPQQVRAYHWLLAHESEVLAATLAAIQANWDELGLIYSYDDGHEARHSFPARLRAPEELCGLLALHTVDVSREQQDVMSHIGLAFSCEWDSEHGLGVLLHHGQVRGIGSSDLASGSLDEAFVSW